MKQIEYVEITDNKCYGGCCTISGLVRKNLDPKKYLVVLEKATCGRCGRVWSSLDNRRWRHRLKLKSHGYKEDDVVLEITDS